MFTITHSSLGEPSCPFARQPVSVGIRESGTSGCHAVQAPSWHAESKSTVRANICEWSAYFFLVYVLASCGYLVLTRNFGTPLRDSYDERQLLLKQESAGRRRTAFYHSLLLSFLIVLWWRPFHASRM